MATDVTWRNNSSWLRNELSAHHEDSYGWACACSMGNREWAADVLQDAYCKILSGKAAFEGHSAFRTWLFGVIRLTALEHARVRKRQDKPPALNGRKVHYVDEPASVDPDVSAERLWSLLARLSRRQQECLHLVFYQNLTLEGTAEVLGITVGSVRQHYARGKDALRKLLVESEESVA